MVKVVIPIHLGPNISKTAGVEMLSIQQHLLITIGSLLWGITVGYPRDSLASCYKSTLNASGKMYTV